MSRATGGRMGWMAALVGVVLLGGATSGRAQYPMRMGGYYSARLGAQFQIGPIFLPGYGTFIAARIVSYPEPNSPLGAAGLSLHDVITRLDGIQVSNYAELDSHYDWTTVRFIKHGSTWVQDAQIYIPVAGPGLVPAPAPLPAPLPAPVYRSYPVPRPG